MYMDPETLKEFRPKEMRREIIDIPIVMRIVIWNQ